MGRKLAFNRHEALQTVMESFWLNGYEATSMRDLAEKLGLHLGSVYNTLGTKEKVFEDALRLHIETHIMPRLDRLRNGKEPFTALAEYLTVIAEESAGPGRSFGCFIINSLHEITRINDSITAVVHQMLRDSEEAIVTCIRHAQAKDEIDPAQDPQKLASFVSATQFAMHTMCKIGVGGVDMNNIKNCALDALKRRTDGRE